MISTSKQKSQRLKIEWVLVEVRRRWWLTYLHRGCLAESHWWWLAQSLTCKGGGSQRLGSLSDIAIERGTTRVKEVVIVEG